MSTALCDNLEGKTPGVSDARFGFKMGSSRRGRNALTWMAREIAARTMVVGGKVEPPWKLRITETESLGMCEIEEALIALKADHLELGAAWRRAHELAQRHEGTVPFDRLHALLHRVEGDDANAAYWYRRAGEPPFAGEVMAEVDLLIARARETSG